MPDLPIPKALLDFLDEKIPPSEPKPGDTIAEIMFHAGRRSVVETLKTWRSQQERRGNLSEVETDPDVYRRHL